MTKEQLQNIRAQVLNLLNDIDAALSEDAPAQPDAQPAQTTQTGLYDAVIPLHAEVAFLLKSAFARNWTPEALVGIITDRKGWDWKPPVPQTLTNIVSDWERGHLQNGKNHSITNPRKLEQLRDMLRGLGLEGQNPLFAATKGGK